MSTENEEPHDIRSQAQRANNQDELWVCNSRNVDESCNGLKDDREAKGNQEYSVEECAQNLCS